MRPKGKLLALFAIFVAIGLVTASGAFTSTSVDRTMTIGVADDSAALLGLAPNSTSQNGGYADGTGDVVSVTIDNANLDADTHVDHVLNVSNNGDSTVDIWVTLSGTNTTAVTLYQGPISDGNAIGNAQGAGFQLASGASASVSIRIDTRGTSDSAGTTLVDTVTFHAATP